jgi:hypothetical protein
LQQRRYAQGNASKLQYVDDLAHTEPGLVRQDQGIDHVDERYDHLL